MICKVILIGLLASASLALGSPVKGRRDEGFAATKSSERQLASPTEYHQRRQQQQQPFVEQQRELSKTRLVDEEQKRVELPKGGVSEQRKEEPLQGLQADRKGGEDWAQKKEELSQKQEDYARKGDDWSQKKEELVQKKEELVQRKEEFGAKKEEFQQKKEEFQVQKKEELGQQREEVGQWREEASQQREEPVLVQQQQQQQLTQQELKEELAPVKSQVRYEAKTQVRDEEQVKQEQLALPQKTHVEEARKTVKGAEPVRLVEQQKLAEEEPKPLRQEQQREVQFEQQQQQQQLAQQVELSRDFEQQRFEPQQLQETDNYEQRALGGLKGAAPAAPIPETEPYAFDYSVEGSSRRETGDTKGVVRGQYTLSNPDGSRRVVDYIADRDGFRATVNTNEFGTESRGPANVNLRSSQPAAEDISLRLEGKTREFLQAPAAAAAAAAKGQAQLVVEQLPARPENWNFKGASYAESQVSQFEQSSAQFEEAPRLEFVRPQAAVKSYEQAPVKSYEQAPVKSVELAPVKEISRLEQVELPAAAPAPAPVAAKGEEPKWTGELKGQAGGELKATEQLKTSEQFKAPTSELKGAAEQPQQQQRRLLSEEAKSAELRKPKSIDLYSTRVTATAHRPIVHVPARSQQLVHHVHQAPRQLHQQHHSHQVAPPVRHYASGHHYHQVHHSSAVHAPVRVHHAAPVAHQAVAPRPVHEHGGLRGPSHPRAAAYSSVVSEEDAPIGFEASRS